VLNANFSFAIPISLKCHLKRTGPKNPKSKRVALSSDHSTTLLRDFVEIGYKTTESLSTPARLQCRFSPVVRSRFDRWRDVQCICEPAVVWNWLAIVAGWSCKQQPSAPLFVLAPRLSLSPLQCHATWQMLVQRMSFCQNAKVWHTSQ